MPEDKPSGFKLNLSSATALENQEQQELESDLAHPDDSDDEIIDFDSGPEALLQPSEKEDETTQVPGRDAETEESETSDSDEGGDSEETVSGEDESEDEADSTGEHEEETGPGVSVKEARDYSKFEPEDREWLKKLPNRAFKKMSDRLEELYSNQRSDDSSGVYDNPNAYLLSPEYQESATVAQQYGMVAQHWQEQLARIKSGEAWQTLAKDPQTGQIVIGQVQEASPQAEAQVISALSEAQQLAHQYGQEAVKVQRDYATKYKRSINAIDNVLTKYVESIPKSLRPIDNEIKEFLSYVPKEFSSHPMAKVSATLYSILRRRSAIDERTTKETRKTRELEKEQKAASTVRPRKSTPRKTRSTDGDDEMIDFDNIEAEFKNIM